MAHFSSRKSESCRADEDGSAEVAVVSRIVGASLEKGAFACAVLAGGRAARFGGFPKGLLPLPTGLVIIERLLVVARRVGLSRTAIVASDRRLYGSFAADVLGDLRLGLGPLGGIEAALHHFRDSACAVVILPCDLPAFSERELFNLLEAFRSSDSGLVVGRVNGRLQPLCAVVGTDKAAAVGAALDRGVRRVSELWRELKARPVDFPEPAPFTNLNSPADAVAWQRKTGMKEPTAGGEIQREERL